MNAGSQDLGTTSVERAFPLSATACSMVTKTPTKSRPGSRANDVPGLADQKDTDRLMNMMTPATDSRQPWPAICPICGLSADNAVTVRSEHTATATYCDTEGHLFSVTWLEVA